MANGAITVQREEHKYLVTAGQAATLTGLLEQAMRADSFDDGGGYRVKSLYLDTPFGRDLRETVDGIHSRQKLRLRLYDEDDKVIKLECKQKRGTRQRKVTLPVTRAEAEAFCRGENGFLLDLATPDALEIYRVASLGYRPVAVVEYNRRAFYWPSHDTRVTLDSAVVTTPTASGTYLFQRDLPWQPALPPGTTVLEVKYNGQLEPFIKRLLRGYCDSRQSVSKYANSRMAGYWMA